MAETSERRIPKFRRRAEARPDEVLDAALDLFIEQGFAQTRVEDIARRAGISKGAVYLYFPSKEKIIEGLVRRAVGPIADSALGFLGDYEGDPRLIISTVLKMLGGRLGDPKVLAIPKLLFREVIGFPELAAMYRREVLDRVIPVIEGLIARGIDRGYFRPVDPQLTIRSIIGPLMLHIAMAEVFGIMPEGGISLDKMIDNHLTILFDGLSAPPSARQWSST
ncbi:MAG: TetR/AcrR family transcriptional regulator [Hyphomicrobiales bacterium]|nr:MAG: TetR/AcrR family transcriptional regulator [Hyphomicrobiales bacterium]